jgi:hypothetical protein
MDFTEIFSIFRLVKCVSIENQRNGFGSPCLGNEKWKNKIKLKTSPYQAWIFQFQIRLSSHLSSVQ